MTQAMTQNTQTKTKSAAFLTFQSTITMLSQMVGGSLVAVPYLFYSVGWVIALIVFTLTVIAALVFYHYVIQLSHATGATSYR